MAHSITNGTINYGTIQQIFTSSQLLTIEPKSFEELFINQTAVESAVQHNTITLRM